MQIIYDESGFGSGAGIAAEDDAIQCPQCEKTTFIPNDGQTVCDACGDENEQDEAPDRNYDGRED